MAKELAAIPNIELETAPVPVAAPEEMPEQPLLFEDEELRQPEPQDVAAPNSTPPPVEVAGLGKAVLEGVKGFGRKVKEKIDEGKPIGGRQAADEPVKKIGDQFVIREASDTEVDELLSVIGTKEGSPPIIDFESSSLLNDLDELATAEKLVEVYTKWAETMGTKSQSFVEMIKAVEREVAGDIGDLVKEGLAGVRAVKGVEPGAPTRAQFLGGDFDGIFRMLFARKRGQPLNARQIIGARLALRAVELQNVKLVGKINAGIATDADKQLLARMIGVETAAGASFLGGRAELGRGLVANRIVPDVDPARIENLSRIFEEGGTAEFVAQRYAALPTSLARAQFSRGVWGKAVDVWQTIFLNSLLSSFVTQARNLVGNFGFSMLQIPERALAGTIGAGRRAITGNKEGIRMREALSLLYGYGNGFPNAVKVMLQSAIDGTPASGGLATKLDVRTVNPITGDNLLPESVRGLGFGVMTMGRAVDALGVILTLPGRTLMSVDEFFKAWNGHAEVRALALRRMQSSIDQALVVPKGKPKLTEAEVDRIIKREKQQFLADLEDPPPDIIEGARDFAETVTFTRDLEGALGNLQTTMMHPIIKVGVPFFKTPTNIGGEVLQRAGPLAIISPRFRKLIRSANPADRDLAMSRLALGSAFMYGMAQLSSGQQFDGDGNITDETIITGAGPTARGAADAFKRQELQPYSICTRGAGGAYTCRSYARMEPISALMAIASDFADYARYSDDPNELNQMAQAAALAAEHYVGELPMVQGMSQLVSMMGQRGPNGRAANFIDKVTELLAASVIEPVMSLGFGGMIASIERMQDPLIRDATPDPNLPIAVRGFYAALLRAKSRNPWFNKDIPVRLNLLAKTVNAGNGRAFDLFDPIRTTQPKFDKLNTEIMMLNFAVGNKLTMAPFKTVNGVKLTVEQKNFLIIATNDRSIGGANMGQALLDLVDPLNDRYHDLGTEEKIDKIAETIAKYRGTAGNPAKGNPSTGAIAELMNRFPVISDRIEFNNLSREDRNEIDALGQRP